MILVVNAPPISKIAGIAKEFQWVDKELVRRKGRSDDHYLIEPKDWHDPSYLGINMIVNDFVARSDMPKMVYDRCVELGFGPVDINTMYAKLNKTFDMIFNAMDEVLHIYELDILFPLPWGCPPGEETIFTVMHGVLHDQYSISVQDMVEDKGAPIAIRYTVKRKDEKDETTDSVSNDEQCDDGGIEEGSCKGNEDPAGEKRTDLPDDKV